MIFDINSIINIIGNYGALFVIIISIGLLYSFNKFNYLSFYLIGIVFNSIINIILKIIIQEPRPNYINQLNVFRKKIEYIIKRENGIPFNLFGMPSGHVQNIFYTTTFIFLTFYKTIKKNIVDNTKTKNNWILLILFYLFMCIIIFYQRIKWKYHTIFQCFIGAIIGSIIGYCFYYSINKKIDGFIDNKIDDFSYFTKKMKFGFI